MTIKLLTKEKKEAEEMKMRHFKEAVDLARKIKQHGRKLEMYVSNRVPDTLVESRRELLKNVAVQLDMWLENHRSLISPVFEKELMQLAEKKELSELALEIAALERHKKILKEMAEIGQELGLSEKGGRLRSYENITENMLEPEEWEIATKALDPKIKESILGHARKRISEDPIDHFTANTLLDYFFHINEPETTRQALKERKTVRPKRK